jgi:ubiquinone/menaquinone biosynthesis C-methylase UbiE
LVAGAFMEERKKKERDFHNMIRLENEDAGVTETRWSPDLEKTIKNNPLWANMKYYAIERQSREFVLDWYNKNCIGKTVLDYCSGNGEDGVHLAQTVAQKVYGIDISDVSIENCKNLAKKRGVSEKTEYHVADAENTGFEDSKFDIITEYGSLHHLDLDAAYSELARIVNPGGKVICNEALRHNIPIHLYRKLTPKMRTEWEVEHILGRRDIMKAYQYFDKVEIHLYYLATLFAVPFRNTIVFKPMLKFLEVVDSILLKIPGLKWQAWQTVFILSEPKK